MNAADKEFIKSKILVIQSLLDGNPCSADAHRAEDIKVISELMFLLEMLLVSTIADRKKLTELLRGYCRIIKSAHRSLRSQNQESPSLAQKLKNFFAL